MARWEEIRRGLGKWQAAWNWVLHWEKRRTEEGQMGYSLFFSFRGNFFRKMVRELSGWRKILKSKNEENIKKAQIVFFKKKNKKIIFQITFFNFLVAILNSTG